jgi:hypothetical protein
MKAIFSKSFATAALTAILVSLGSQSAFGAEEPSAATTNPGDIATAPSAALEPTAPQTVKNSGGDSVEVGANGVYSVKFALPAWTFAGNLAQDLTDRKTASGADKTGEYSEITFTYAAAVRHSAGIRLYKNFPIVVFSDTTQAEGPNNPAFPCLASFPKTSSHLSFGNIFSTYNFRQLFDDDFWLFFDKNRDAFIISPLANYMVSGMAMRNGAISCGINASVRQLPAGFNHKVILTAQNGINRIYSTWGNALLTIGGKTPPANDAAVELNKLGYWTDNGATYYYRLNEPMGIRKTLIAARDEFAGKGVPIGYVQLDSWFYPKGARQLWNNTEGGFYEYKAHPTLFPDDLAAFQKELGLPLMTHNRWLDPASPYRTQYATSGNVVTDPKFWVDRMAYLKSSGVVTYEQDWLGFRGMPTMNLTDGPAFMDNMQAAATANGINMQYCMIHGRHYLQGSLYPNLMSIRTSQDRFNPNRWTEFLYGSRMAQAMGIWPWCDVYMSRETRNLLISTLSAGIVGVGDRLGAVDAANLSKSVRSDGVIVKPDVPLTPVDDAYVNDAQGLKQPFVATTYTDHGGSRTVYVFAYGENRDNLAASFKPADSGIPGDAYVYDYFAAKGELVKAGDAYKFNTTMPNNTEGGTYLIAVSIGPSGIGLVGDTGKFVTRGKKRIPGVSDSGSLRVDVAFADGETKVTLCGYAPSSPNVQALSGTADNLAYEAATHIFTLNVSPDKSGKSTVGLSVAK